jgi:phytoene dehydrogenase-like protein
VTGRDGFDAVVVGSGPNGLIGALALARHGQRVLLLEAADRVGGALRSDALTRPGFTHDIGAAVLPLALASPAFRELGLTADEVRWAHPPVPAAHPLADGDAVLVHRELSRTVEELGRDGPAWRRLIGPAGAPALVDALLSPLSARPALRAAPALVRYGPTAILPAAALARVAFREPAARAALAGMAAHSMLSLRAASTGGYGTLLAGLAHSVGWPVVTGGTEQLAIALAARLRALGGEIHTGVRVGDLGELPPARTVLLDLTPRQFAAIAGDRLPAAYRRRLAKFRYGPGVFKLDYALAGPMPWRDERVRLAGTVHVGGSLAEITAAEADVATGRPPDRPFVLCVQPAVADPSRAPAGQHPFWAYCHVPNGSTVDMTAAIEAQLERFAPGFRDLVTARHRLAPADLETFDANLVGGDIGGGSAALSQFVARPVLSARPWATPLPGVYLASASTPPGAGVHGMGGWHAARLALRNLRGGRD